MPIIRTIQSWNIVRYEISCYQFLSIFNESLIKNPSNLFCKGIKRFKSKNKLKNCNLQP